MIKQSQLTRFSEAGRERFVKELHWWQEESWPFLAPLVDAGLPPDPLKHVYEHAAFLYEAAARFDSPRGSIRWAMGRPFGGLTLLEAGEAKKAFPEVERWTINYHPAGELPKTPPGDWSRPLEINLRATWQDVSSTLKPWLETERKSRGVEHWRRQVPWEGLEAFDRQFAGLRSREGENRSVAIKRARDYYRERGGANS